MVDGRLIAAVACPEVASDHADTLGAAVKTVAPLIEYSDAMPTVQLRELADNLILRAEMELAKLDRCLADDVAAFNARCRDAGLGAITPK